MCSLEIKSYTIEKLKRLLMAVSSSISFETQQKFIMKRADAYSAVRLTIRVRGEVSNHYKVAHILIIDNQSSFLSTVRDAMYV